MVVQGGHKLEKLSEQMVVSCVPSKDCGADSDVLWLQRDFGLFVLNLFDTSVAARDLGLPRSLGALLQELCDVKAKKELRTFIRIEHCIPVKLHAFTCAGQALHALHHKSRLESDAFSYKSETSAYDSIQFDRPLLYSTFWALSLHEIYVPRAASGIACIFRVQMKDLYVDCMELIFLFGVGCMEA